MNDFYFNEWAFLAETDPASFERRRRECIAAFIAQSGSRRQNLEALQAKIDRQREAAPTPAHALAAISQLMCASLTELAGEMSTLADDLRRLTESRALREKDQAQAGARGLPV